MTERPTNLLTQQATGSSLHFYNCKASTGQSVKCKQTWFKLKPNILFGYKKGLSSTSQLFQSFLVYHK